MLFHPLSCGFLKFLTFGGRLGGEVVGSYRAEDKLQIFTDEARRHIPRLDGCHITLDVYSARASCTLGQATRMRRL